MDLESSLVLFGLNGVGRIRELVDLTLESLVFKLNQPDEFTLSGNPLSADARAIMINRTEVQVWIQDGIYSMGVPRKLTGDGSKATWTFEDVLSYLMDRYITQADLAYTDTDQFSVAWGLIQAAQTGTNMDRRISSAFFSDSGVPRTITYKKDELPNVWDALQAFTSLENGFDFDMVYYGDGRREWTPYFPYKGTRKPQFALEYDEEGSRYIKSLTYNEDGATQATDVIDSGASVTSGDPAVTTKLIGRYENVATSSAYGRIQKVVSDSNIDQQAWLDARAQQWQSTMNAPPRYPDLLVDGSLFGLITTGDIVPVRVDYGVYQINGDHRITEITWQRSSDDLKLVVQPV